MQLLSGCSNDIEHMFSSKTTRKLKKLDTFLDALTYMLTDGSYLTADGFLVDHQDQTIVPGASRNQDSPTRLTPSCELFYMYSHHAAHVSGK
jgi:hypothetical protein